MAESGSIPWADAPARPPNAAAIAGALAEAGVHRLTIADTRACRTREVIAGQTNLPRELLESAPGTVISGEGVAILIDERDVRWVADGDIAAALANLTPRRPVAGPRP